jgi:hypothetical protein
LNKKKIINDPVHGFIKIPSELIFDILQHPYFQRLRRIRQLGLSEFIYPGAVHTRYNHALGAMHLMGLALETLRSKGIHISDEEFEATQIAILLHDIGHGPMSHALENTILQEVHHESLSYLFMCEMNKDLDGKLALAIQIFTGEYARSFLHQLVSSQLDMDRMDYLLRDSFFTGVSEGKIGADRIIKMLSVVHDKLVVEEKGIYSIEDFLTARRLMYWQVYLHKTNVAVEQMLIQCIRRARHLLKNGTEVSANPALMTLLREKIYLKDFQQKPEYLQAFADIDDYDIWSAVKGWASHSDRILSLISKGLLDRQLFKVILSTEKIDEDLMQAKKQAILEAFGGDEKVLKYVLVTGTISNEAYLAKGEKINILHKTGKVQDIAQASDLPNIKALRKVVKKYYVCWLSPLTPKGGI